MTAPIVCWSEHPGISSLAAGQIEDKENSTGPTLIHSLSAIVMVPGGRSVRSGAPALRACDIDLD